MLKGHLLRVRTGGFPTRTLEPIGHFWSVSWQLPLHQARPFDSEYRLTKGTLSYLRIPSLCRLPSMPSLPAYLASPMFTQTEPQAQLAQRLLTP